MTHIIRRPTRTEQHFAVGISAALKRKPAQADHPRSFSQCTLTDSVYIFGEFTLDCGRFELYRLGQSIKLERKPLRLLIRLVASNGALVTRTAIAETLWDPQTFVDSEHGINTAIRKIRAVLRDDKANPRFIKTVSGMGYRFVADVRTAAPVRSPEPDRPRIGAGSPASGMLRSLAAMTERDFATPAPSPSIDVCKLRQTALNIFTRCLGAAMPAVLLIRGVLQRLSI